MGGGQATSGGFECRPGSRTGSAGVAGRRVGARFECRPVTSKQQSPASAAAVPTRGQAEPLRQFTSAMPRDDGGGMPRLRSATGLRGAKQSLEPQRQLTLAMRWCRRGRGGRRRAREARARGRGLGRKRGLWRHIEYVWRAQAAEGAGLPGAATERLSTGAAKAWLCVASATFCYLAPRRRWREAQSTPPASARRRLCRPRRRST